MKKKSFMDPLSLFSHELKTPISSLKLALDLIQKNHISQKNKNELIGLMDQEINRMISFINDILDFRLLEEKGDLMKLRWDCWGDIIEQVVKSFKLSSRQKDIHWKIENLTEGVEVFMDSLWIRQVIENLISNAIRYSPDNSIISISSFITPSGALRISVQDGGKGVSPEEQKRLFEAFYKRRVRGQETFHNTGLGLAIARAIIEKHQGIMGVSSTPQGSLFYFELPEIRKAKQTA